jgi:pimeloyl-ACP methyl ester carboxylesterase
MSPATKGRLIAAVAFPLLLLHGTPSFAAPTAPTTAAASATETRMDHISIMTMGDHGSPVVLIPGLSSPRAVWDGVAPAQAKDHRVYLVQVNGFGGGDPGKNLSPGVLDGIVADLDAYIAREKLGAPAIVGHSMGGLVGLMFAKAHPDHVAKLMIVDSLPFYGMLFGPTATVAMVEPHGKAMRDRMIARYGQPADAAAADMIAHQLAAKPDSQAKVKAWAMAADPRVSGEAMYEDLTTDLRPDMDGFATPITLVYPAPGDALYHAAYGKAAHVTYVPVEDAAHFVMLDQPQAFDAAIAAFTKAD